ncbi:MULTISPECIES: helix-turn-helix transcriptional regulator [unclassified Xanthobacter]|uniref:helix-turn-helix transcriptional regulator n=1 Tax=unclassified Xanthobacter TaxID=2623496 RepID=UPI001F212498|nr:MULTISPECIES: helix-turn-helix transcriptional regulator [unclassified Xanthobacter]
MQVDLSRLNLVLDELLHAAIGPAGWVPTLDHLMAATGADGVNFMPIDGRTPDVPHTESLSRGIEEYFRDGWAERDYRSKAIPILRPNSIVIDSDFMSNDEYENEYFRFSNSYKLQYAALSCFQVGAERVCCALHRGKARGPYMPEEARALAGLSERFTLASSVARSLSEAKLDGLGEAFERMKLGAIFFDRSARVIKMNAAAEALIGSELQVSKGELKARLPMETRALQRLVQAVTRLPNALTAAQPVRVTREGKRPLILRFQQIDGFMRDYFSLARGMAVIDDLDARSQPDTGVIQQAFGLTPTEAAIALLLARGEGAREIARMRAISYETVRTHIRSIFHKLGVNRQAEVGALLGAVR